MPDTQNENQQPAEQVAQVEEPDFLSESKACDLSDTGECEACQ